MAKREVVIELEYDNVDITANVAPYIENFRYVDRTLTNKMDEISVTFQDIAGLWINEWLPKRGATLKAKINAHNWLDWGDKIVRDCGGFEIDDMTSSMNPASTFQVSAISVGITNSIRRQQNTKAWEEVAIKQIAQDIADKHGFELKWFSEYNPVMERWEQKGQSDLSVLIEICEYAGLMIKITDKYLVIFRGEEFDKEKPSVVIWMSDGVVKSWEFNMSSSDIYSAAELKYYDPVKKELVEYIFYSDDVQGAKKDEKKGDIPDPEVGQILKINRRVKDIGEAKEVAKAALRSKNMRQVSGSITMMGRPDLYSGMTLLVNGFGRWDRVIWNLEEISHDYSKSGGYSSTLTLRGTLEY
jgi:phage protein D